PHDHVVMDAHVFEQAQGLEGAAYAGPPDLIAGETGDVFSLKLHRAAIRGIEPGDHIEKRSLTRSVWADDGVDGTLFYRDIHAGECRKTAKVFTDGMGLKNSVCHTISPFLRPSKRPGLFCPCGPCKNFA